MSEKTVLNGKVVRWARPYVMSPGARQKPTALFVLHLTGSQDLEDLSEIPIAGLFDDETDLTNLVTTAVSMLDDDADGRVGPQRYVLQLRSGEDIITRLPLRLARKIEGDDLDSEPANARGLVAGAQRHTEAIMRIALTNIAITGESQNQQITRLTKLVENLSARLEAAQNKNIEMIEIMEDLRSQQHLRNIATTESNARIEAKQSIIANVQALLPAVVRKFTGETPENFIAPETLQARAILLGLTEEELQKMQEALPAAKFLAWLTFMEVEKTRSDKANGVPEENES